MKNKTFLIVAVVLVIAAVVGFIMTRDKAEPEVVDVTEQQIEPMGVDPDPTEPVDALPPEPEVSEPAETEIADNDAANQEPEFDFPEPRGLDQSDEYLKEVTSDYQKLPAVKQAAESRHVVRRGVTAVDRVLRGENPNRQLSFLQPEGKTVTETKGGKVYLSKKNYLRYEPLVDSLEEMDTRYLVALYRHLSPMLVTAYDELGYGDQAWEVKVSQFISKVLAVKVPEGPIELQGSDTVYIFADEKIEQLPAFDKVFIRMGPENTKRVQRKFRQLRQAMREM